MNRLIEVARKEHHQKEEGVWRVQRSRGGPGDCPGESELRLQMSMSEVVPDRLMWATLWIFTLSSKQWESINGFQPWCDRGRLVFQKDHLGCQVRMDLSETQQCLWSISQLAPTEIQVKRGGSLRLKQREINSQIEIEVGSVINGVHVDWMQEKRNVKSNYFLFSFFDHS